MPTLTKSRLASASFARDEAARNALAKAHADLAEVLAAVAEREAEHDAAIREYRLAQARVQEIKDYIDTIAARWKQTPPAGRDDLQARIDDAQQPLADAKRPLMELGKAVDAAEARLTEARQRVGFYQSRLHDAAVACTRTEADPIAKVTLERVQEALQTLLALGPDLECMASKGLVHPETRAAIAAAGGGLLNRCIPYPGSSDAWTAYGVKYQGSPWRSAVAALEQDPDAALPLAPTE